MLGTKEAGQGKELVEEEALEERESTEALQKTSRTTQKEEMPVPGECCSDQAGPAPAFTRECSARLEEQPLRDGQSTSG